MSYGTLKIKDASGEFHSITVSPADGDEIDVLSYQWHIQRKVAFRREKVAGKYVEILLRRELSNAEPSELVKHANGDVADYRRENLVKVSRAKSIAAPAETVAPAVSTTTHVGVKPTSGGWNVTVWHGKMCKRLGTFAEFDAACQAYDLCKAQMLKAEGISDRINFVNVELH